MQFDRRDFLRNSAGLAGLLAGGGMLSETLSAAPERKKDNDDRLNVAVIGVRGRGRSHVGGLAGKHGCVVTHICDADSAVVGNAMRSAERAQGSKPKYVQDLRRIMDDKSIDVVTIATPNHWHALAAIWAMQAGKDVYVEKPVSHNVWEGRRIVEVARDTKRICQTGTQSRSSRAVNDAIAFVKSGKLGRLEIARGLCYKRRGSIGDTEGPQKIPETVDYNLWCGPAPKQPLRRKRLHYDWHWTWDYGNGDLGNQGIHQMDIARWGLGKNALSNSVVSVGGRFGYEDDGETANTQICLFDYGDAKLIFEVRGLPTKPRRGVTVGNIFHLSDGYVVIPANYRSAAAYDKSGKKIQDFGGGGNHYENFIDAVRSRKQSDLNAEILEGHLSSALCHLGNISYRLGTAAKFDGSRRVFGSDKAANETFQDMREHLSDAKVPLDKTTYQLGKTLQVEPKTERFVNDEKANAMLTRNYRKGFEVPKRKGAAASAGN